VLVTLYRSLQSILSKTIRVLNTIFSVVTYDDPMEFEKQPVQVEDLRQVVDPF
jgi:hypothetical protein